MLEDNSTTLYSDPRIDSAKLDETTIHYLTSERQVGFINYIYELQHRGVKQLSSESSVQVK